MHHRSKYTFLLLTTVDICHVHNSCIDLLFLSLNRIIRNLGDDGVYLVRTGADGGQVGVFNLD